MTNWKTAVTIASDPRIYYTGINPQTRVVNLGSDLLYWLTPICRPNTYYWNSADGVRRQSLPSVVFCQRQRKDGHPPLAGKSTFVFSDM